MNVEIQFSLPEQAAAFTGDAAARIRGLNAQCFAPFLGFRALRSTSGSTLAPAFAGWEDTKIWVMTRLYAIARVRGRVSSRYSFRSATIGSTFVARRAGIQQANSATLISNEATAMKVRGSF